MIYLDTSALGKLVVVEAESEALRAWLRESGRREHPRVTNVIGVVELRRLALRVSSDAGSLASRVLARIDKRDLSATAVALAADVPPAPLRAVDALHIASAAELPELTALVSYDHRVLEAAADFGLPVASPR